MRFMDTLTKITNQLPWFLLWALIIFVASFIGRYLWVLYFRHGKKLMEKLGAKEVDQKTFDESIDKPYPLFYEKLHSFWALFLMIIWVLIWLPSWWLLSRGVFYVQEYFFAQNTFYFSGSIMPVSFILFAIIAVSFTLAIYISLFPFSKNFKEYVISRDLDYRMSHISYADQMKVMRKLSLLFAIFFSPLIILSAIGYDSITADKVTSRMFGFKRYSYKLEQVRALQVELEPLKADSDYPHLSMNLIFDDGRSMELNFFRPLIMRGENNIPDKIKRIYSLLRRNSIPIQIQPLSKNLTGVVEKSPRYEIYKTALELKD